MNRRDFLKGLAALPTTIAAVKISEAGIEAIEAKDFYIEPITPLRNIWSEKLLNQWYDNHYLSNPTLWGKS